MEHFSLSSSGFRYDSLLYICVVLGSIIGIPGTIITMRFYGKRIKKASTSTALFLTSLAVFDMLSLVTNIPVVATTIDNIRDDEWEETDDKIVLDYIARIPKYWSNMLILLIGIERVLCVILPHRTKDIFTRRVGIVCIIFVFIIGPLALFPMVIVNPLVVVPTNDTVVYLQRRAPTVIDPDAHAKWTVIGIVIYFGIPVIGVLISNICLAIVLVYRFRFKQAANRRTTMTPSQVKELRTTKLVMIVTVIFIVCVLPIVIFPMATARRENIPIWFVLVVRPVSVLLETINNSMNFVVYYIGSRNFRTETRAMLSRIHFCRKPTVTPVVKFVNK